MLVSHSVHELQFQSLLRIYLRQMLRLYSFVPILHLLLESCVWILVSVWSFGSLALQIQSGWSLRLAMTMDGRKRAHRHRLLVKVASQFVIVDSLHENGVVMFFFFLLWVGLLVIPCFLVRWLAWASLSTLLLWPGSWFPLLHRALSFISDLRTAYCHLWFLNLWT